MKHKLWFVFPGIVFFLKKKKKVNTSLFILIEKESQESLIEESAVPGFETKTKVCLNPQAGPWTDAKHPGSGLPPRGMAVLRPPCGGRGWPCVSGLAVRSPRKLCTGPTQPPPPGKNWLEPAPSSLQTPVAKAEFQGSRKGNIFN